MKTPWYETSAGATVALLLTRIFVKCNLYSLFLVDGSVYRYAVADFDVKIPGYSWDHGSVVFDADAQNQNGLASWKTGTNVSTWQTVAAPRPIDLNSGVVQPDMIAGQKWIPALRSGVLDGAECQVDRAVFSAWPAAGSLYAAPVGVVTIFYGRVAAIDLTRTRSIISVNSHAALLQTSMPRNQFQSQCRHTLFDSGCALTASSYAENGTVVSGGDQSNIWSGLTAPGGSATYSQGRLVMTSGANNGFGRGVRLWTPPGGHGVFSLVAPFYFPVLAGDTFTAYPGCDKTKDNSTGCTGFSNVANFGGQPDIPAPETAV